MSGTPSLFVAIKGSPVGQPRPRCIPGRRTPVSTMKKEIKAYREHMITVMKVAVKHSPDRWRRLKLFECNITAYYPTKNKKLWGRYCGKVPDRDNIDKLILDCAKTAGIIKDDAGAVEGGVRKLWAQTGDVHIAFRSLDGVDPPDPDAGDLGVYGMDLEFG
ncbi:hypothetical protein LCGC14_2153870 [marine sediment metagenome]|uniref:Uncharacterized protein n=1 Tax=marine sediment metagenome TaxID=412755 RepID=A0A0F9GR25_9ZZZZ